MKNKLMIIPFLFILFALNFVSAETHIISNSADWRDVYSSMMYSNFIGLESDFLVSTSHGPILLNGISKDYDLLIITSRYNPIIQDYYSLATSNGFNSVDEIDVSSANLYLIEELYGIKNFIVIDDSYGYNALAVVAYAFETSSWVFLANKGNINEIDTILSNRNVNNLLLYGYLDPEITNSLSKYNPEIIDTGDKFQNNIEIVKKYSEVESISQVILSSGEFIEKEIMQGKNAFILIEEENAPSKIIEYLKSSNIQGGVLIGNELIGAATNIRQSAGINVMVKFSRSARESTEGVSPVAGLDLFYITSLPEPQKQKILIQEEEPSETVEYTEVTTESNPIQIPPGNKPIITGEVISEKESNLKNNLLLSSLIIGGAIIIGFAILAFVLRKR